MIEAAPAETGLRPRSEGFGAVPQRYRPASGETIDPPPDVRRFERLLTAVAAAVEALAGLPVQAAAGGWNCPEWTEGARTQVAASLAALLASIRLGGAADATGAQAGAQAGVPGGVAVRRVGERLAAAVDELAAAHWPDEPGLDGIAIDFDVAGAVHNVWVAAPVATRNDHARPPSLVRALLDQPLRMAVPVSSEMVEIGRLLPFVAGTIWPIAPQPVMPLAFGGQRIATVRIEPTPDGRQQAVVVGVDARRKGEPL